MNTPEDIALLYDTLRPFILNPEVTLPKDTDYCTTLKDYHELAVLYSNHEYWVKKCLMWRRTDLHDYKAIAHNIFLKECEKGRLDNAKLLYKYRPSYADYESAYYTAFVRAIEYEHLKIAKWIYSIGMMPSPNCQYTFFNWACQNGDLKTAQWLYSLGDCNIHPLGEDTPFWSAYHSNKELFLWIWSLDKEYFNSLFKKENDRLFAQAQLL